MRNIIICYLLFLSFIRISSAQFFIKAGSGLVVTETYKNDFFLQSQGFLHSETINYSLSIGIKKSVSKLMIQVDHFDQKHEIDIESLDLTLGGLKFQRPVFTAALIVEHELTKFVDLSAGLGALSARTWDLKTELDNDIITVSDPIQYQERSITPTAQIGLSGSIKLSDRIEIESVLQLRTGLVPINSSFSWVLEKVTDRFTREWFNFLYIDHGNSFNLNINLIYYL